MPGGILNKTEGNGSANGAAPPARQSPAPRSVHLSETQFAVLEMIRYGRILAARWWLILGATILIAGYVGIRDKYFSVKWYRAQATITPVNPEESMASSIGMGSAMSGIGSSALSLLDLGGDSGNVQVAEQYMAIMNSYAFTIDLIKRYNLTRKIAPLRYGHVPHLTPWSLHKTITGRFSTSFDYKSGNLTLYFVDPDPKLAQTILGDYLTSLRDKLRNEEVQSAAVAVASLEAEIGKTPDALLQNQLYELVARQIQREKLAQVEADFAYTVIEPPIVPDQAYAPQARRHAELAAAITFVLLAGVVLMWEFVKSTREDYLTVKQLEHPAPPVLGEPPEEPMRPALSLRTGATPRREL